MEIKIIGWLKLILTSILYYKIDYGWPSEKVSTHELIIFRTIYIKWNKKTNYWD